MTARRNHLSKHHLTTGGLFLATFLILLHSYCMRSTCAAMASSSVGTSTNAVSMESRLRGALWGFFSGDALASPSHWYYGGLPQIKADYGHSITDYTQPNTQLAGSIMNKSNTNGGGRGSFTKRNGVSIIGDIINHGKREYWNPKKSIHYHATLQAGENTLEAQLGRVLMKSIVETNGVFDKDHFRKAYMDFMQTPGSHNDTYASTCHRMFFANLIFNKLPPEQCPDNDHHNVDTIDGLVLPTIAALSCTSKQEAGEVAAETASVTRDSKQLESMGGVWGGLVYDSIHEPSNDNMPSHVQSAAKQFGMRQAPSGNRVDQMTACYLSSSIAPTLDMICKYLPKNDAWTGLVANANVGGENVHRGSILGAVLGARAGQERLPPQLKNGLHDKEQLQQEIDAFVKVIMQNKQQSCSATE